MSTDNYWYPVTSVADTIDSQVEDHVWRHLSRCIDDPYLQEVRIHVDLAISEIAHRIVWVLDPVAESIKQQLK